MDQISHLLSSSKLEDQIAGIFLSNRLLESTAPSSGSSGSRAKVLSLVFHNLTIQTLFNILRYKQYPAVQRAILNFFIHACSDSTSLAMLHQHKTTIITLYFSFAADYVTTTSSTPHTQGCYEDMETLLIHMFMASSSDEGIALFHSIVHQGSQQTHTYPHLLLHLLSEACQFLTPITTITLSALDAGFVQSCVIQGLHGAAKESVRDVTLQATAHLLKSSQILNPAWIIRAGSLPEGSTSSSLLSFLCSIVYGELHLLEEEQIYYVRKVIFGEEQEEFKGHTKEVQDQERCKRGVKMFYVCLEIVDWIVNTILTAEDEEDQEATTAGAATSVAGNATTTATTAGTLKLSFLELQQLHKDFHKIIKECWEYFQACSMIVSSLNEERHEVYLPEIQMLRITASRVLQSVQHLIYEDAELRIHFFQHFSTIMKCSLLTNKKFNPELLKIEFIDDQQQRIYQEQDVLCHLIPLIQSIMQEVVYESFLQDHKLDEECELMVDKVCEHTNVIVQFTNHVLASWTTLGHDYQQLVTNSLVTSIQTIRILLLMKEIPLKTLIRGEGVKAFDELFQTSFTAFQQLHSFLTSLHKKSYYKVLEVIEDEIQDIQQLLTSCTELELSLEDLNDS